MHLGKYQAAQDHNPRESHYDSIDIHTHLSIKFSVDIILEFAKILKHLERDMKNHNLLILVYKLWILDLVCRVTFILGGDFTGSTLAKT